MKKAERKISKYPTERSNKRDHSMDVKKDCIHCDPCTGCQGQCKPNWSSNFTEEEEIAHVNKVSDEIPKCGDINLYNDEMTNYLEDWDD